MKSANQNSIPAFRKAGGGGGGNNVDLSAITDIIAFGDSYTDPGLQAVPASNSYINKLIATTGKGLTNRGATGTGIWTATYQSYLTGTLVRPQAVTCMAGLNDSNRNGGGATFISFWKDFYRTFLCSLLTNSGIPGSDATGSVNWSAADPDTNYSKAHQFGALKRCKRTLSVYPTSSALTYTFTDDHVILGYFIAFDNFPVFEQFGIMEVRIDGVLVDTINCTVPVAQTFPGWEIASGGYPRVTIYSGLSLASHTIDIRCTLVNNGGVFVDYFGHFGAGVSDTKAVILADVTYITNYAQAAPYNQGSTAAADAQAAAISELITELKTIRPTLPIAQVFTNTDLPLLDAGDYNVDGLHWDNDGHAKGETKFLLHISAY